MPTETSQKTLEQLLQMQQDARNNLIINTTVKDTVGQILNSVENDDVKLNINNLRVVEKYDNKNIAQQKEVRNKGQSWSNDLRGDIQLIDKKTNKVVDSVKNMKVADIPKITDRGTFLIGGIEYQFTKQARLKPGVYTNRKRNGEINSFFNVDKTVDFERGFNNNFKLGFDPEKKVFMMTYGTKNVPLINALRTVGVTNKELEDTWGKDVFSANSNAYDKYQDINQNKLYEAVFGKHPPRELNHLDVSKQIKERLFATELDPKVTTVTLGKPYKEVNKDAILDASKKILDINRGVVESDDREALIFKSFHDVEDHIREKLIKGSDKIINNIKYKLGKNRTINKSLSPQMFNSFTIGTITNSSLSNPPSQTNPLSIIGESSKFSIMGEGGIGSMNAVTNEARQISNSQMGFIDPLHTPEGPGIGVAVHTTLNTVKVGNDIYSKFLDPHGKKVMLSPLDVYNKNLAFPDQFTLKNGKPIALSDTVKVINAGKMTEVHKDKVDFIVPSAMGMFDTSANSIPFLDSIQPNRGLTASKMQEQALSLKHRDKPLFKILNDKGTPFSETLADVMALPKSPVDGKIKKIARDHIIVKDKRGDDHKIHLYNNFSLNTESFFHNEPVVKEGDSVKEGDRLADNNFTKDGQLALGANLRVAYIPYRGYNYEDSAIMSESAAKKLTSQHIYDLKTKRTAKGVFSANKFKAYYPEELTANNIKKLDKDGIIIPGQTVEHGDIVIAHLEKKVPTADDLAIGRLDKQLKRDMADHSVRWENNHVGVVTDVKKQGNSVIVNIKTEEPLKVADKISGLHGNKHIISKIVPDDQMPFDPKTGKHIELTMSPIGVSGRINTSQLLESAIGKIAEKTGEQYPIRNFSPVDNSRKILEDLKSVGLSDKDILVDPVTKKPYKNPIATGVAHILKLEHKVDHKFSARYKDGYDSNEQPVTGGETGAKNLGRLEIGALLARGANENLKEMYTIKGQRNDEYWKAMETGQSLPPPKNAFVWDKMLAMMHGSGINVQQKGKTFTLKPMTDAEIIEKSKGELLSPTDTYRFKDMAPMKEGLFDPVKAGGIFGEDYTHFKLPEKTLNPIAATAAATLIDLPLKRLENIVIGKQFVDKTTGQIVAPGTPNSVSGGPALEILLNSIKPKEDLKQAIEMLDKAKNPTEINRLNKKIKYLKALEKNKMKPTDYLIQNVLVIPSKYRPVFTMGANDTVITSDVNDLYQQTAHTANALKELNAQISSVVKDEDVKNLQLAEARGQMYQDLKAVYGLQEPTSYLNRVHNKKGFVMQIDGGEKQTKEGYFQDKVVSRKQDIVGRSTIILNPNLGGDEIGIPKEMATKIFQPFIMKKMVSWGYSPLEAQKHITDETPIFDRARQVVTDEKLVIANRAPSLHRWNMTAFKPRLVEGKSIEVPTVVVQRNFGGDFDGDTFQIHVPISPKAQAEAERMKPSASMLKVGYDEVLNRPLKDVITGAWLVSKGKGGIDTGLKFDNLKDAQQAYKQNKFDHGDSVQIGKIKAPYGMHEINSVVPEGDKKWDIELNDKNTQGWIRDITKKHNGKLGLALADKIKEVGNNYATDFGFTLGVSDTVSHNDLRNELLREANKKIDKKNPITILKAYSDILQKGHAELAKNLGEHTMVGIGIKSGGGRDISNTAAINFMPGIVTDANEVPILMPITKSYSEGLDTVGYWAASHGARGGNIKKSISSSLPGWMTKDLMSSLYETRIVSEEPADQKGIEYSVEDKKGIMNRFLAKDVKTTGGKIIAKRNEVVSSDVVNKLNQHKIKSVFVQSPLTDPTPGDGFSSYSYGTDYNNKLHNIGDNIGIMSAHTVTEPALNWAMKAFHTGGALELNKKTTGTVFDKLWNTLKFTQLPNKATLASMHGVVDGIKKSSIGGWDVILNDGNKQDVRYINANNEPVVKKGDIVKPGDFLSTGDPSPHDILKYKGMPETQKFLVDHINEIVDKKLDKRDIETMVRGLTNTTRILDPGSHPNFVKGDTASLTMIEDYNNRNKKEDDLENTFGDHLARNYGHLKEGTKIGKKEIETIGKLGFNRVDIYKDRIKHEPFLTPTGIQAKAKVSEDWIARLAHNRLDAVLREGATQGWKTEITSTSHPLPSLITGTF